MHYRLCAKHGKGIMTKGLRGATRSEAAGGRQIEGGEGGEGGGGADRAVRADKAGHVFDDAKDRQPSFLAKAGLTPNVVQRHPLRCRHEHRPIGLIGPQVLHHRKVFIRGALRKGHQGHGGQCIQKTDGLAA